jgi:hypothetical protein
MIDVLVLSASLFLSPSDSVSWESDARVGTCVEVDLESAAAAPPRRVAWGLERLRLESEHLTVAS